MNNSMVVSVDFANDLDLDGKDCVTEKKWLKFVTNLPEDAAFFDAFNMVPKFNKGCLSDVTVTPNSVCDKDKLVDDVLVFAKFLKKKKIQFNFEYVIVSSKYGETIVDNIVVNNDELKIATEKVSFKNYDFVDLG